MTRKAGSRSMAALTSLVVACGGLVAPGDEENSTVAHQQRNDDAFIASSVMWPTTTIPVCWENDSPGDVTERAWVQDAVAKTWQTVSAVRFTGWGRCVPGSGGIRIVIADDGVGVKAERFGVALDGLPSGMRLNFSYLNWTSFRNNLCAKTFSSLGTIPPGKKVGDLNPVGFGVHEGCIRVDAVHEFGHALGFAHEHSRPDHDPTCPFTETYDPKYALPDMVLGAYDPSSVMNYCNRFYSSFAWPWIMSDGDTRAVQLLYGAPTGSIVWSTTLSTTAVGSPASLAPLGGNCLQTGGTSGSAAQLSDCNGSSNQNWITGLLAPNTLYETLSTLYQAPGFLEAYKRLWSGNVCLESAGAGTWNGTPAQAGVCSGITTAANQAWTFPDVEVVGFVGKCLDAASGSTFPGIPAVLSTCAGNSTQHFHFDKGQIVRNSDRSCLMSMGGGNGSGVVLWPCIPGFDLQRWDASAGGGVLRNAYDGRCLDVKNFGTADGTPLQTWDCNAIGVQQTNQRWSYRGALLGPGGKCLQVAGSSAANGVAAQLWDCSPTDRGEVFTYYP